MSESEISRRGFLKLTGLAAAGLLIPTEIGEAKTGCGYFDSGDSSSRRVAITIDDGWQPELVEKIVQSSCDFHLPISAFPVGKVIRTSSSLWRSVKEAGIEIYNHTLDHRNLANLDKNGIRNQLSGWEKIYEETFNEPFLKKVIRPPFGEGVEKKLFEAAERLNYKGIAGWKVVIKNEDFYPEITSGAIILLHFTQKDLNLIPKLAEILKEKKLEPVPLSQLPGVPIYEQPPLVPSISTRWVEPY